MKSKLMCAALTTILMVLAPASSWAADGAAIYKAKCAMCHGADGSGDSPMGKKIGAASLKRDEVKKMSDAQVIEVVTKGKNKMPAYDKKLTGEEIAAVVAYVRTLK